METIVWLKNIIFSYFPVIFSAITGLLGVYIGAWLINHQNIMQRKLDFYEKQLRELYSPLVGIRKEIRILSEFRLAGYQAQNKWWKEVCKNGNRITDTSLAQKFYETKNPMIDSQIEYENNQLTKKIIPAYRELVNILRNNYWLAEEETKDYFPTLIKFVETWERHLSDTHSAEVLQEIAVSEDKLLPFYENIEKVHNNLRKKLKNVEK